MVELKTAEHLIYFMQGDNISLSRYDERFINSLASISQVTTNQIGLFNRLLHKYNRQFAKHELFPEQLVKLPWTMKVVESSPQYTDGHISIENNTIIFKCPYNRNFITEFRNQPLNKFAWNKETRWYEIKYGIYSLKFLIDTANKFFETIHYCEKTLAIIDELLPYETAKYWEPTLVKVNGNLMIAASNAYLDEAIKDIKLDTDPITLSMLVFYGINIDSSLYDTNDATESFFANRYNEIEVSNILNIIPWLQEINCDHVYFSGSSLIAANISLLRKKLKEANITFTDSNTTVFPNENSFTFPILIKLKRKFVSPNDSFRVGKIIQLVNSQPIEIK